MTKAVFTRRNALLAAATIPALAALPRIALAQAPDPEGEVDIDVLMEAGPLEEQVEGAEDAPITVVEYASMTCGHCRSFHVNTWPAIKENYVDTGKVRFILREFPFDPRAAAAFMLARCAPGGKYFPMVDVLFKQQDVWARAENARAPLENIAKLAGFTQESFEACLTNQELLDDINAVRERGAAEFGVNSTPTFFINGKKYAGALTVEQMSAIFDDLL
jgi:protein-disulfide isomerase